MSQLIVCQNSQGIIIAADSKAVAMDISGKVVHLTVNRMLQIGPHAAILTGGAAEGMDMIKDLKSFVEEDNTEDVQEAYEAALPFLATQFEAFMRKMCEVTPLDPIHQVYFILGGYTDKDPDRPFRLYLLWTKRKLPQLDGDEISLAYSAPRLMGLEYKLSKLCQKNTPLEEILPEIRRGMEDRARKDDEVGPPFRYAVITRDGFREV